MKLKDLHLVNSDKWQIVWFIVIAHSNAEFYFEVICCQWGLWTFWMISILKKCLRSQSFVCIGNTHSSQTWNSHSRFLTTKFTELIACRHTNTFTVRRLFGISVFVYRYCIRTVCRIDNIIERISSSSWVDPCDSRSVSFVCLFVLKWLQYFYLIYTAANE